MAAQKGSRSETGSAVTRWLWLAPVVWTCLVGAVVWYASELDSTIRQYLSAPKTLTSAEFLHTIQSHHTAEVIAYGAVWVAGLVVFAVVARHLASYLKERERVQASARQAWQRSQLFFERQAMPMAITSPEKKWEQVNDPLCDLLGYSREELLKLTWDRLTHPDDLQADATHFDRMVAGKIDSYTLEKRFVRKDGGSVHVELSASCARSEDGKLDCVLAVVEDISERKASEAALRESERKYRELVENVNSIILRWTPRGEITFLNEFGQKFFGWTQAELVGGSVLGTIVPETETTGRDLRTLMDRVCDNPAAFETNVNENVRRDGTRVWIAWTNKTVFDAAGNLVEVLSIGTDVTEQRRAEEAIKESEKRYRSLFEANPHPMWVYDLETLRFVEVNDAAVQHYGYSREEFLGMTIAEIRPAEEVPRLVANLSQHGDKTIEKSGIWRHRKKDGSVIDVEIISHPLQFFGRKARLVLAHDVTEMLHAQARYRSLFDNSIEGIYQATQDGTILAANPALAQMLGFVAPEELITQRPRYFDSFAHEEDWAVFGEQMARRGILTSYEHELRRKDGTVVSVSENTRAVRDPRGQVTHYEGAVADVTPRKQAEREREKLMAQLVQAQKMEAVGQLAGGIAHDFNNILAAMLMQLELLQMEEGLPDQFRPALAELEQETTRAANLTRQLLMFSRRQVMQARRVDANALVANLLKMLRRLVNESIDLRWSAAPEELWVHGDPGMLEQVLMNLVVNARDAMPNGGQINISTSSTTITNVSLERSADARQGRFACIRVTDTGCGMDSETFRHLFEPFFTTKEVGKGTGLGLATVYGILKQHNGWAEAESTPGRGSTFRVFLPIDSASDSSPHGVSESPGVEEPGGNETVLVVEDELSVRSSIVRTLSERGYTVLEAANGNAALKLWENRSADVDLLLSDIVMPEGITGLDLADRLCREKHTLKVLLISGYTLELAQQGLPANANISYLAKPFTGRVLSKAVRDCLDARAVVGIP